VGLSAPVTLACPFACRNSSNAAAIRFFDGRVRNFSATVVPTNHYAVGEGAFDKNRGKARPPARTRGCSALASTSAGKARWASESH
jgi:hypothetical protein